MGGIPCTHQTATGPHLLYGSLPARRCERRADRKHPRACPRTPSVFSSVWNEWIRYGLVAICEEIGRIRKFSIDPEIDQHPVPFGVKHLGNRWKTRDMGKPDRRHRDHLAPTSTSFDFPAFLFLPNRNRLIPRGCSSWALHPGSDRWAIGTLGSCMEPLRGFVGRAIW